MAVRAKTKEQAECRQCCAFCDKTVHPRGCIEVDCPFLYTVEEDRLYGSTDAVQGFAPNSQGKYSFENLWLKQ